MPPNLFFGTGIPACIIVIDKENANVRTGIFMIDASRGFMKDGNKNRLRDLDIHRIVDVFNRQVEVPRFRAWFLFRDRQPGERSQPEHPPVYDSSEPEDLHDLEAHLRGDP